MENTAKTIEYITHHLMADYMQKLVKVEMGKITLFTVFPVTGAPNLSNPHHFIKILNPNVLSELLVGSVN